MMTAGVRYSAAAGRYSGRRALVTGGANGLGFASATRLADEGAAIGLLDIDPAVEEAAERLNKDGHDAVAYIVDVTDDAAVRSAIGEFARGGAIDVLATFAGIYPWVEFADMDIQTWRNVLDVNLAGVFSCTHAVMPFMKQQNYGRIVTISSDVTLLGLPGQSAYAASKSGVIGLTRVLAREGGPHGVTANAILPGLMATERVLSMREDVDEFFELMIAGQCIQRRGDPQDIADAVAYLASEGAEFVTGQSLSVGGGNRFI